eukprot:8739241-Pyramimonas_sp.AAC.1
MKHKPFALLAVTSCSSAIFRTWASLPSNETTWTSTRRQTNSTEHGRQTQPPRAERMRKITAEPGRIRAEPKRCFPFRFVFVLPRFVFNPPLPQNDIETKAAHEIAKTPFGSSPGTDS